MIRDSGLLFWTPCIWRQLEFISCSYVSGFPYLMRLQREE